MTFELYSHSLQNYLDPFLTLKIIAMIDYDENESLPIILKYLYLYIICAEEFWVVEKNFYDSN